MQTLQMGSDYRAGFETPRPGPLRRPRVQGGEQRRGAVAQVIRDRELATNFCAHTMIGDPECESPASVTRSTSSNRSRPSAARFVRQSVQPSVDSENATSPPLIGHSQVGAHRGIAAALSPRTILARSAKACEVFRTHRSRDAPRHPRLAAHRSSHRMVILLWTANPEDTSSRLLLLLTSVTPH